MTFPHDSKRLRHWIAILVVWGYALVPGMAFMVVHNPQALIGEDLCSARNTATDGTGGTQTAQHHCPLCALHGTHTALALPGPADGASLSPRIWLGQEPAYRALALGHLPPDPATRCRPIRAPPTA